MQNNVYLGSRWLQTSLRSCTVQEPVPRTHNDLENHLQHVFFESLQDSRPASSVEVQSNASMIFPQKRRQRTDLECRRAHLAEALRARADLYKTLGAQVSQLTNDSHLSRRSDASQHSVDSNCPQYTDGTFCGHGGARGLSTIARFAKVT